MTATMKTKPLPVPSFVKPQNAADHLFIPDQAALFASAEAWRKAHAIKPCGSDKVKIEVLVIDAQNDFCNPKGSLYVAGRSGTGAIDDNKRLVDWLYRNMGVVTGITATMDTHFPYQIFFPSFWRMADGSAPAPFTTITTDMIRKGEVAPNPAAARFVSQGNFAWLKQYVEHYTKALEATGKYQLTIWPFHCILGSHGHALNGLVHEARVFHSFVRGAENVVEVKGGNPLTENYSVLSPEVLTSHDGRSIAQRNVEFIKKLLANDAVVIAGQAASHCVKSSIDDLLTAIKNQDPELAKKVYIMTDTTSAVTVPDGKGGFFVDWTQQADDAFAHFAHEGMNLVKSTDPIESWPGLKI